MQQKSVSSPSFLEISSLLKLRTGISPRFFSQKMTTELPDKKMPNPHQPLGSGCVVGVDSLERPLRLLHDWREGLYGVEELVPLVPILDVAGVDVEALHFTRDVLRHYLEAVKASRLGNLDMYNVTMILGFNLSSILFIFDFKQKCETALCHYWDIMEDYYGMSMCIKVNHALDGGLYARFA